MLDQHTDGLCLTRLSPRVADGVVFEDQPIGVDVRSRPLSLRHSGSWQKGRLNASTYAGVFVNIETGALNDDLSYSLTRAGATPDWSALRLGGRMRYALGTWALIGRLNAQYTSYALIPGEQFGVGGLNSVRGIDERELTGDRGLFLSLEVMSPPLAENAPRILGFVDTGRVSRVEILPGEVTSQSVVTVGAGLRWAWRRRINFSLDYGYVVDGTTGQGFSEIEDGDGRFHFQILGRI